MWFRKNVNGKWSDAVQGFSWMSYLSLHARSRFTCIFGNNSFWSPRCLGFDSCGRKGRWPRLLLSCCFRVTLFRSKIRNKFFFFTFALHHAVKTIQGRGCSSAQHARTLELFQVQMSFFNGKRWTPNPLALGGTEPRFREVTLFRKKKIAFQIHVKNLFCNNCKFMGQINREKNKQTDQPRKNSNLRWYLASVVEHNYTFYKIKNQILNTGDLENFRCRLLFLV